MPLTSTGDFRRATNRCLSPSLRKSAKKFDAFTLVYEKPDMKVTHMIEESCILAASNEPGSITISTDDNDVIDQGYVDAKQNIGGIWDE